MKIRTLLDDVSCFVLAFLAALACGWCLSGCAGAPRNVDQLDAMDDEDYAAWRRRVEAWAVVLAAEAVKQEPRAREELLLVAGYIQAIAAPSPTALADMALDRSAAVSLLLLELQAYLDQNGALASVRALDILAAVASGITAGAGG